MLESGVTTDSTLSAEKEGALLGNLVILTGAGATVAEAFKLGHWIFGGLLTGD